MRSKPIPFRCGLVLALLAFTCLFAQAATPAHYQRGATTIVKTFTADSSGGVVNVRAPGTPLDGLSLEIERGTFAKPVTLSIGYNQGTLRVNSGTPGKLAVVLEASGGIQSFTKPIRISVKIGDAVKREAVVGYAISPDGRLRPVDSNTERRASGVVTFTTYGPLMFTWVFSAD